MERGQQRVDRRGQGAGRAGLDAWARRLFPFGRGTIAQLTLAYLLSTLYFYIPVGTLYLQSRGLTYVQIHSLWAIIVFTMFLSEVPAGLLADRLGRRWAVRAALGLQLVGELVYLFARAYPGFVLASVAGGIGFALGSGSVEAMVYASLQAEGHTAEMTRAMGQIEAGQRLSNLIAFPIGGWIVRDLSAAQYSAAIALTAAAVGLGFVVTWFLKEQPDDRGAGSSRPGSWVLLRDALRLTRGNRAFRGLMILFVATVPFRDYLGSLYQPRLVSAGVPAPWLGIALSLASGLSFLAARSAHRVQARLGNASLLLATALPGSLYFLFAAAGQPWSAGMAFCLLYGSMSWRQPIFAERLNRHIANGNRATVISMISMISGIYVAAMGLVFGRIADLSVRLALVAMGSIVLAGALLFRAPREPAAP